MVVTTNLLKNKVQNILYNIETKYLHVEKKDPT